MCIKTNADLAKLADCTSIDYLFIWGCHDCTQETFDSLKLKTIRDAQQKREWNTALSIIATMPGISSLAQGFSCLQGQLHGGLSLRHLQGLTTLDGLQGITAITEKTRWDYWVSIKENKALMDVSALEGLYPGITCAGTETASFPCAIRKP